MSKGVFSFFTQAVVNSFSQIDKEPPPLTKFYSTVSTQMKRLLETESQTLSQNPTLNMPSDLVDYDLESIFIKNRRSGSITSGIPIEFRREATVLLRDLIEGSSDSQHTATNMTASKFGICLVLETLGLINIIKKDNEYKIDRGWLNTPDKTDDLFINALAEAIDNKIKTNIRWDLKFAHSRAQTAINRTLAGSELVHAYEEAKGMNGLEPTRTRHIVKALISIKTEKNDCEIVTQPYLTLGGKILPEIFCDFKLNSKDLKDDIRREYMARVLKIGYDEEIIFDDFSPNTGVRTKYVVRLVVPIFKTEPKIKEPKKLESLKSIINNEAGFSETFVNRIDEIANKIYSYERKQ